MIFFLFLIFDFEPKKFLDERIVSLFLRMNKDIKNNLKFILKEFTKYCPNFYTFYFYTLLFYFIL